MLDYLKEILLETMLEFAGQVALSNPHDREMLADAVLEKFAEEVLFEDLAPEDIEEELDRLRDENESLWAMLDELKRSNMGNFSEELSETINRKLVELTLLATAKPSGYEN